MTHSLRVPGRPLPPLPSPPLPSPPLAAATAPTSASWRRSPAPSPRPAARGPPREAPPTRGPKPRLHWSPACRPRGLSPYGRPRATAVVPLEGHATGCGDRWLGPAAGLHGRHPCARTAGCLDGKATRGPPAPSPLRAEREKLPASATQVVPGTLESSKAAAAQSAWGLQEGGRPATPSPP